MALSKQQQKDRRIGGSSSSIILGLNKYKRQEALRREISYSKHGREAIEKYLHVPEDSPFTKEEAIDKEIAKIEAESNLDNKAIRIGTFLEAFVRERLKKDGYSIRVKKEHFVHPEYDFITANIDGREGTTVEEIKCISIHRKHQFGEEWTDECDPAYAAQAHHYMLFPQFNKARLRCLFLSESEKELVDRMIKGMISKYVHKELEKDEEKADLWQTGASFEFNIPRFGSLNLNKDKLIEYHESGLCQMNLDIVQNIVNIAPLQTYVLEEDKTIQENLIEKYKEFWHRATNNIPCVATTLEDCQIQFDGYSSATSKIASDLEKRLKAERDVIAARQKKDKARLTAIMAELMIEAQDADIVLGADGKAIYRIGQKFSPSKDDAVLLEYLKAEAGVDKKAYEILISEVSKPADIDWKKVEKKYPELFQKCRKKSARAIQWPKGK